MNTKESLKEIFASVEVKCNYSDIALETIAKEFNTGRYDIYRLNSSAYDMVMTVKLIFTEYNSVEECCKDKSTKEKELENVDKFILENGHVLCIG